LPSLPWLSLWLLNSQSGQTKRSLSSLALFESACCSPSRNVLGVACAPHAQILRKGTALFSLLSTKLLEVCQPQLGADVTLQSSTTTNDHLLHAGRFGKLNSPSRPCQGPICCGVIVYQSARLACLPPPRGSNALCTENLTGPGARKCSPKSHPNFAPSQHFPSHDLLVFGPLHADDKVSMAR
jgi:hypothetical protein